MKTGRVPRPRWRGLAAMAVVVVVTGPLVAVVTGPLDAVAAPPAGSQGAAGAKSAVGAYPTEIDFGRLARGTESLRGLGVINGGDRQAGFTFEATGDIATWVRFVDATRPEVALSSLEVTARSDAQVGVLVTVPRDAPNGNYSGAIKIVGEPSRPTSPGATPVQVAIETPVRLTIDASQIVAGKLVDVGVTNILEIGMPLRVRSTVENTGNVLMTPRVDLNVLANDRGVEHLQRSDWRVEPGTNQTLELDWDTSGLSPGNFEAAVAVDAAGVPLGDQRLPFRLVPRGTLNRKGELERLRVAGGVEKGGLTRLRGHFKNTGEVEVAASLRVEVNVDGVLSNEVSGDSAIVPPGSGTDLELLVPTRRDGHYHLVGTAVYDGVRTNAREVRFTMVASSIARFLAIVVGVAALVAAVVVWFARRRRKRSAPRASGRRSGRAGRSVPKSGSPRRPRGRPVFSAAARRGRQRSRVLLYADRLEIVSRSVLPGVRGRKAATQTLRLASLIQFRSGVGRRNTMILFRTAQDSVELRLRREDARRLRTEITRLNPETGWPAPPSSALPAAARDTAGAGNAPTRAY